MQTRLRTLGIPRHSVAARVNPAQIELRVRVALVCRLAIPPNRRRHIFDDNGGPLRIEEAQIRLGGRKSLVCGLAKPPNRLRIVLQVRCGQLVRTLRADFREEFINTRSYRSTEDQVGRDFDRAENYLSLVGLVIVILGGIAVSSVTRVFILQKIRSIAVLKCTGATSAQIMAIYMLQVMVLGLAGSVLGVAPGFVTMESHRPRVLPVRSNVAARLSPSDAMFTPLPTISGCPV
jgi:energy-converting hydrogenase Eha subunit C